MKTSKTRVLHTDVPTDASDDVGAEMRERAAQSCGYSMGQDLSASREEMMRNGGPEAIVDRASRRIERGDR